MQTNKKYNDMKIFKGKQWGFNFETVSCAQCKEQMPKIRVPENPPQTLWGGWTCPECGCKMDKWGKPIDQQQVKHLG